MFSFNLWFGINVLIMGVQSFCTPADMQNPDLWASSAEKNTLGATENSHTISRYQAGSPGDKS